MPVSTLVCYLRSKNIFPADPCSRNIFLETQSNICSANEYTSIEDAVSVADFVLANGLAGAMTWDVNRDCR